MRKAVYSRLEKVDKLKLSILICTVPSRISTLEALIDELNYQIVASPVEFISLGDNKRMSVGAKRNNLLALARGEWLCFVDDDDSITVNYVEILLKTINDYPTDKKVICFKGTQTSNGAKDLDFKFNRKYGMNHRVVNDGPQFRGMMPNHLCVWKSEIAKKERFQEVNLGEDHRWATAMMEHYTEEEQVLLDQFLYHYEFDKINSECRR